MNSKAIFRDSILFCGSLLLNLLFVFSLFKFVRNINILLLGIVYGNSSFDSVLMKIHTLSLNGIFIISFCFFIYLDLKTILTSRGEGSWRNKTESELSLGKKEYINKAYNLYDRIPIEYPLNQTAKIYAKRLYLTLMMMLPFYMLAVVTYLFLIAPIAISVAIIIVFLGAAILYLYDFQAMKKLETSFRDFFNRFKPDEIKR